MGFTGFYCFFSRIYLVQPSCNGFQWVLPSFSCRVVPSFAGPLIGTQRVPFSRFAFRYCRLLLRSSISAVVGRAGLEDEGGGGVGGPEDQSKAFICRFNPPLHPPHPLHPLSVSSHANPFLFPDPQCVCVSSSSGLLCLYQCFPEFFLLPGFPILKPLFIYFA